MKYDVVTETPEMFRRCGSLKMWQDIVHSAVQLPPGKAMRLIPDRNARALASRLYCTARALDISLRIHCGEDGMVYVSHKTIPLPLKPTARSLAPLILTTDPTPNEWFERARNGTIEPEGT